jgi:hypothetical protein
LVILEFVSTVSDALRFLRRGKLISFNLVLSLFLF